MTDLPDLVASVPSRLGVTAQYDDGELKLLLHPTAETCHCGSVRASVVSFVVDAVAGIILDDDPNCWTFTTDMSIRMRPVPAPDGLVANATVLRRGGRSASCRVDVVEVGGQPVAVGALGFARVPRRDGDPPKPRVSPEETPALFRTLGRLTRPLRDEAGIEVLDPAEGIVEVEARPELCNSAGTLQGAMVALVAEVAAEELLATRAGAPVLVTDLDLRYLAKAGAGTIRTRCRPLGTSPDAPVEVELVHAASGTTTTHAYARGVTLD
jgi:acyl-coenzyme A thioesterase PaaI-like protein